MDIQDPVNATLAYRILFTDPETGEELRPFQVSGNELYVSNKDGSRNYKHTITTEEI